jgi:anti-sigma regulatory factor (Ser/Thr protein kinase)
MTEEPMEFVDVQLLSLPVAMFQRARQHHDALIREFALISMGDHASVPGRLLALTQDLQKLFSQEATEFRSAVDEAVHRGDEFINVAMRTPTAAAPAVVGLFEMLDEADRYCRDSTALLTLAAPAELLAVRKWYLGQIVDQLLGGPAVPWGGASTEAGAGLEACINLEPHPSSAGEARRFVRRTLEDWGLIHMEEAAVLLTSELITNAMLHAGSPMELKLHRRVGLLRVEVCDDSRREPARRHYEADATTGRGLALVEALASEWGVDTAGNGKSVWFTLAVDATA